MFIKFFSRLFGVSPQALDFIIDEKYGKRLWIILPLTGWAAILYQVYPLFFKWQIDTLTQGWTNIGLLKLKDVWQVFLVISLGSLAIDIVDKLLIFTRDSILQKLNNEAESYLEDRFQKFLRTFDGAFLGAENNLRMVRSLQQNMSSMQTSFTSIIQSLIEIPVGVITLVAILPLIHPYLLGVITVSVVISLILDGLESNKWRQYELVENRRSGQRWELRWLITSYFSQLLANGWIAQLYNSYTDRRTKYFETNFEMQQSSRWFKLINNFVSQLANTAAILIGGFLFLTQAITIGTFTIFNYYVTRVRGLMEKIGDLVRQVLEMRFSLFKLDFILHIKPKLDYTNIQEFTGENIKNIEVRNLFFRYPEFFQEEQNYMQKMQERLGVLDKKETDKTGLEKWFSIIMQKLNQANVSNWRQNSLKKEFKELEKMFTSASENKIILNDLSFKLEKGKIYALVGYNGAGKTTITKLIKRTLDPSEGQILIDGRDLKTIDPLLWRKNIASVEQQDFILSALSVRENLMLGIENDESSRLKLSDKELWEAIEIVGLKSEIADLDLIMEENLDLSGGQKQLLEIARVYLQKKPIVILDEGTNQLDAIKENQILKTLQKVKNDTIVIFITHRMTTCNKCDEVLVLDNGQLVTQGKPADLLASNTPNLYQTFWNLQVEGKEIEG